MTEFVMCVYSDQYILIRHNPSEPAKVVFLLLDLLWVYGKGLRVKESRATVGLRGCNLSVLGVSLRPVLTLHKHVTLAWKHLNLCVLLCIPLSSSRSLSILRGFTVEL